MGVTGCDFVDMEPVVAVMAVLHDCLLSGIMQKFLPPCKNPTKKEKSSNAQSQLTVTEEEEEDGGRVTASAVNCDGTVGSRFIQVFSQAAFKYFLSLQNTKSHHI